MERIVTIVMQVILIIFFGGLSTYYTVKIIVEKINNKKQNKIKKKREKEEIEKNSSIDLSTLPFSKKFKEEFDIDFFEFKNGLNKIYLSHEPMKSDISDYLINDVFMYNDHYFYLYDPCTDDHSENKSYLLMGNDIKTDFLIELYKKTEISDFKKRLYSIDDLLYINVYTDKDEIFNTQPSNISLAIKESIYGTAAAMKSLMNSKEKSDTFSIKYYIGKFIFSEKTNLPVMYSLNFVPPYQNKDKNLYNQKTVEHYQEKIDNRAIENGKTVDNDNYNLEKIKKLKELLDCGAITQEEFEKKKKELLELQN